MKFIHAADLHLDTPLRGLSQIDPVLTGRILDSSRNAFVFLVDRAIIDQVDFIVIAGDLFEGRGRDYSTALFLMEQLKRLEQKGILVFLIWGNHDLEFSALYQMALPKSVKVFSSKSPETYKIEHLKVALHGISFSDLKAKTNVVLEYPEAIPGYFNIGVLHSSVNGNAQDPYFPCALEDLLSKRYNYWALGHIHERALLKEDPWIVFPGNLYGRDIQEKGVKGCYWVQGDVKRLDMSFVPLCSHVWDEIEIHLDERTTFENWESYFIEAFKSLKEKNSGTFYLIRLHLKGTTSLYDTLMKETSLWLEKIRLYFFDLFNGNLYIEKIILSLKPLKPLDEIGFTEEQIKEEFPIVEFEKLLDEFYLKIPLDLRDRKVSSKDLIQRALFLLNSTENRR